MSNQNEQDEQKGKQQAESVADLEVSSKQADDIQAGTSLGYPNFRGGIYVAAGD